MSALDAAFWDLEDEHTALHIGGVAVFDGPVPTEDEIAARYTEEVASLPRYRQKKRHVPLALGWPAWVEDRDFELSYHLRRTALPSRSGDAELHRLIGRLMSTRLDPQRPLWEVWVIEGLPDGRWALLTKVHHSLADGIAGMDLFTGVLDRPPRAASPRFPKRDERPIRAPGRVRLTAAAFNDAGREARHVAATAAGSFRRPLATARLAAHGARGVLGYLGALRPAPANSLTGELTSARRYRTVSVDLSDVLAVRRALGGTVNDVALALVTSGFRSLLLSRHEPAEAKAVRCLVPVSVRAPEQAHGLANRVSALLLDLPVEFADATCVHEAVVARMRKLKRSGEAEAGALITGIAGTLPTPAVEGALRMALRVPHRVVTTVVTNVPGPPRPMSMLGRRMTSLSPYVPLGEHIRIGIAVTSYNGRMTFGITCDRDAVKDVSVLTGAIEHALAELIAEAERIKLETP